MRAAVTLGLLLAAPCAFALNPALDVSQYAHDTWKYRDGLTKGYIFSIAQTPDGYLWLSTEFGLVRFDGVRGVPWEPPQGQHLPSTNLTRLLAARDGTLWIGTRAGLASWKNGNLTQYADFAALSIVGLVEDRENTIWVGAYGLPEGKFCEIRSGSVHCHPEVGSLRGGVFLHEDATGNLWAELDAGVWRWKPGPPKFYPLSGVLKNVIKNVSDGEDGVLLLGLSGGVSRLADGKVQPAYSFPVGMHGIMPTRMLRDRDGGLWVGTASGGIVHFHQGHTDVYSRPDGLTNEDVTALFEDREGDVWVATLDGLERFRELPVTRYSVSQGLSNSNITAVLGSKDGAIWAEVPGGLDRLNRIGVKAYRLGKGSGKLLPHEIAVGGMPDGSLQSLFQDSRGRIWVSSTSAVGYLEGDRFVPSPAPGGIVLAIVEDTTANIWIANQNLGLFRLSPANEVQRIPWGALGRLGPAWPLVSDPFRGGVWLGFYNGGIAWWRDGQVQASYTAANGLGQGGVSHLRFDTSGALWASTEGGLSRLKDGHIATLTSRNGLPCDTVHWTIEDDARSVWLKMPCGLVRVARSEMDAWANATDQAHRAIHPAVFDGADGVKLYANEGSLSPAVARSADGKLWFLSYDGLSVIDPHHLPFNKLPPPVHVEQVIADRKTYLADGKWSLPALTRDVEIDYTALSFVAPEKNRFRYKLEGRDRDWHEVVNRRQAFYNDLPPRGYTFRVMATNNDGVWNEAGASLNFSVDPAWYQTRLFQAGCVAAFLLLLAGIYQLRLRQVTRQYDLRMEGRVNERTRIARDLHDTLLQSFQGVLLKFSAANYMLPDRPVEAQQKFEELIEQAREAISEGRDAVQGLRQSTLITNDLVRSISAIGEEFAAEQTGERRAAFRIHSEGQSRELPPLVRDEIYRVAIEAMRNAFKHAEASAVEVEIRYDQRQFRMRVRDDGKGIDEAVLRAGARSGHYGLPGMHERARLAGGKLAVWSRADAGTELELSIPAGIAYRKATEKYLAADERR